MAEKKDNNQVTKEAESTDRLTILTFACISLNQFLFFFFQIQGSMLKQLSKKKQGQMEQSDDGEEKMWIDWKDNKISPGGRGEEGNVQYDMRLSL